MQLDKDLINKMLSLDDETFKNKVLGAAAASGIDSSQLTSLMGDIGSLKKSLAGVKQSDLNKAAAALGTEKIDEIMKNIRGSVK